MVERGHQDRVARDQWVAHEYAKVRWLYTQSGLADQTAIEYFNGGHTINGQGTFASLHKHLNWPEPCTEMRIVLGILGVAFVAMLTNYTVGRCTSLS